MQDNQHRQCVKVPGCGRKKRGGANPGKTKGEGREDQKKDLNLDRERPSRSLKERINKKTMDSTIQSEGQVRGIHCQKGFGVKEKELHELAKLLPPNKRVGSNHKRQKKVLRDG